MLHISLIMTAIFSFIFLISKYRFIQGYPLWASSGASLGVIHWFPLYAIIGNAIIWNSPSTVSMKSDWGGLLGLSLLNFVFPIFTFSGSAYDGTFLIIPLSIVSCFAIGIVVKIRNKKSNLV